MIYTRRHSHEMTYVATLAILLTTHLVLCISAEFNPLNYHTNSHTFLAKKHSELPCYNISDPLLNRDIIIPRKERPQLQVSSNGNYIFIANLITGSLQFKCNESITFTTHSEFAFLDNLVPLVERWQGPVSIAIYAPGSDFSKALRRIRFLSSCASPLVAGLVNFHLLLNAKYLKSTQRLIESISRLSTDSVNCSRVPLFSSTIPSYRKSRNLTYPINIARNFARFQATTHYILSADIELYPSLDLIQNFMQMITRHMMKGSYKSGGDLKRVYVLPTFEVESRSPPPGNKTELLLLLKANKAARFHRQACSYCHVLPGERRWLSQDIKDLEVFKIVKRLGMFDWEPVYIGTNAEPPFDDELTWEGQRNKMTQAFAMCLLDYNYSILNNGFLVHRPGVRKQSGNRHFKSEIMKQNLRIRKIRRRLMKLYGSRKGCKL